MSFFPKFLFIYVALGVFSSCTPPELKELERYNTTARVVLKPLLGKYARAMREATSHKDRSALRRILQKKVLPALKSYLDALQQSQPQGTKLRAIHLPLIFAYTRWHRALHKFHQGLTTNAQWVERAFILQRGARQLARAERAYHAAITLYVQSKQPKP